MFIVVSASGFLEGSGSVDVLVALLPGHYLSLNVVRFRALRVIWRIGIVQNYNIRCIILVA